MKPYEAYLVGRAVVRVMLNSERTDEIHLVEEITGRNKYEALIRREAAALSDILQERPELCDEQLDYEYLRGLPEGTLGRTYIDHLDSNGLSAASQAAGTRYVEDDDMAYLMRRFRQTHDVWHALLNLGVEGHEEVIVHAFSWGQLRLPVSALVVIFGTLKHIVMEGRWKALRAGLLEAYHSGRNARPLLGVRWEELWDQPIDDIRERFGIHPSTPELVHN